MTKSQFRTRTDEAYHRLRQMIEAGQFGSGQKLTELGAAKMLGIGRTSVRQAMHRLEGEGLLKGRHERQGRYVDYFEDADPKEVVARYEVREAIEAQAARLAATNMNRQQADHLLALALRAKTCWDAGDLGGRGEAKMAFLEFLMANCGNALLHRVWRTHRLFPYALRSQQLEEQILREADGDRAKCGLLAEAIAAGDQGEAERIVRETTRQIIKAIRQAATGSQADASPLPAGTGATTGQQTDSLSPS